MQLKLQPDIIHADAVFDATRKYRYALYRTWDEKKPDVMIFIGLNPSTADETHDDPTVRKCINVAKRDNCGSMVMLNIFAYRSTNPKGLSDVDDPVGRPFNNQAISSHCQGQRWIVVAWGRHGKYMNREEEVLNLLKGKELLCFFTNKDNSPMHPLYVSLQDPLIPFYIFGINEKEKVMLT